MHKGEEANEFNLAALVAAVVETNPEDWEVLSEQDSSTKLRPIALHGTGVRMTGACDAPVLYLDTRFGPRTYCFRINQRTPELSAMGKRLLVFHKDVVQAREQLIRSYAIDALRGKAADA